MKVGFGCDHTAIDLKKELMEYMTEKGYECVDYGAYDASVRVDYPDQGQKVAEAIIAGEVEKGVLICGTGIGISLAANKVPGIRAAVCSEPYSAEMTVRHNNAQIIAFGARVVGDELAKKIPIIAMTANAFSEDIQHSLAAGMNAHVSKPIEMRVLEKTIRSIKSGGGHRNAACLLYTSDAADEL